MADIGFFDVDVHLTMRSFKRNGLVSFGIMVSAPSSVGVTQASTVGAPLAFANVSKVLQIYLASLSVLTRTQGTHGFPSLHSSN